jgi:hypothetical protein
MEDKKAKIAERNAHAEVVRLRALRAQQAKGTPRNGKSGEERALAAQQARERHLAQVALNCSEEVKRAKKVAEETKEKKAAEQLRVTEDIERRHADAERRRLQYQQNLKRARQHGMSALASEPKKTQVPPWKPKSEDGAARAIQRAWRNKQARRIVGQFLELNLGIDRVRTTNFEDISSLLADPGVISSTEKMLGLCGLLESTSADAANNNVAVRTFLAAYLILGHPEGVLSTSGEQEEDLIGRAKALLMQFQRLLDKPAVARTFLSSSEPILSLTEAYGSFQTAFSAWKNRDSSVLIETMIAQFVELDAIWQTVKDGSPEIVAQDYKEGIRRNQTMILARLKRLAGPEKAFSLVREAVKARQKQAKTKKRSGGEIRPRAAAGASAPDAITSASTSASASTTTTTLQASAHDRSLQMNELNRVISPLPDNRIVVHELAINKDYRIEVDPTSEARQATNRAVFNLMRADIDAGLGDQWILSMAETIRDKLLRLVTTGNSLHVLISESLDTNMIESQLKIGAFSYAKFFSFMSSILPKLCAPVRDAEVKAFAADQSSDLIERLAKLLHIIDLLGLDYANYLLHVNGPDLISRAAEYEQQCFQQFLASNTLARTHRWWRLSRAHASADLTRRSPDEMPTRTLTSTKVYTTGLVDLFIALPPLQPPDVPETLELDRSRIETARGDVLRIITISSILLTAKNLLRRDVRSQWRAQSQRMWDLPAATAYSDSAAWLSIVESGTTLPPNVRNALVGTIERVLADARASPTITHPVMKVLLQKIKTHVGQRLSAVSNEERVRVASNASEVLGAGGMPEFVGRIGGIIEDMSRVRRVDWDTHGKWIEDVAQKVERESGERTVISG